MVATYEGLGLSLLYPENWVLEESLEDREAAGVSIESPDGVFFSINRYKDQSDANQILQQAIEAMRQEYPELEEDPLDDASNWSADASVELSFYYLDLLIMTRLLALRVGPDMLLIQMQGKAVTLIASNMCSWG